MDVPFLIPNHGMGLPNYKRISGVFKCFQCDYKCSTALELKEHYQIHRSQDPFKCFQCGYEGKDADDFKQHSLTHFEQSYYKCPKCSYKAEHRQSITNHVRYTHKQICVCGKQFKFKSKFMLHLLEHPQCKENVELDEESTIRLEVQAKKLQLVSSKSTIRKGGVKNLTPLEIICSPEIKLEIEDDSDSGNVFVCQICFYIFRSSSELKEHTASAHTERVFNCPDCPFECSNESELNKHSLSHIDKIFLCTACHFIFSSSENLKEHLETHKRTDKMDIAEEDEEIDYVCYICDKSFKTERSVKLHMNHHSLINHPCSKCPVVLKSKTALKQHMSSTHKSDGTLQYQCAKCPRIWKSEQALKQHLATHTTNGYHWCPFCNFKSKVRAELRKHFRSLTHLRETNEPLDFEEEFICFKCDYETNTEEELGDHWLEEHNEGEDDFSCSECQRAFDSIEVLKDHLVFHFKPFICVVCEESFCTDAILNKHSSIHRPDIPLECPICDSSTFESMAELKEHALEHYKQSKPHECTKCTFRASNKGALLNHLKTHKPSKKVYTCSTCAYETQVHNLYQRHLAKHELTQHPTISKRIRKPTFKVRFSKP